MADPDGTPTELRVRRDVASVQPSPIYANQLNITFTPEDFVLHFGWYAVPALSDAPEDGVIEVTVDSVARVVLPLNLVPNVIALLQRQVEAYEQSFGKIPEHPNKPDWMREEEPAK